MMMEGMRRTNWYTDAHELSSLQRWTHGVNCISQCDADAHGEDDPYH